MVRENEPLYGPASRKELSKSTGMSLYGTDERGCASQGIKDAPGTS